MREREEREKKTRVHPDREFDAGIIFITQTIQPFLQVQEANAPGVLLVEEAEE